MEHTMVLGAMRLSTKVAVGGVLAFATAVAIGVARAKPTPTVQITVPRGYRGPVLIVFDEPSGEHLRWLGNTFRLDIPRSGVLKIKEGMDAYPHSWIPTAYTDEGQRLPIPLSGQDGPPFDPDAPARKDELCLYGGTNHDNKILSQFVGSAKDLADPKLQRIADRLIDKYLPKTYTEP